MEPQAPSRDPGSIDRNGLVGVATPRWASDSSSTASTHPHTSPANVPVYGPYFREDITPTWGTSIFNDLKAPKDLAGPVGLSRILRHLHRSHSMLHGPQSLRDHPASAPHPLSLLSNHRHNDPHGTSPCRRESTTEESGGEEILYKPPVPRIKLEQKPPQHISVVFENEGLLPLPSSASVATSLTFATDERLLSLTSVPSSLASSFHLQPFLHKAKKRTPDEFERDQFGILHPYIQDYRPLASWCLR